MMTPDQMAHLHARAFAGQGRAWSAQEFAGLLDSPHVFVVGDTRSFACGRVVADEAELLTIATDPDHRGRALGRACLAGFEAEIRARGAGRAFLEVAEDNIAAVTLYLSAGYAEIARREGYYHTPDGRSVAALVLQKTLS